jgi:hypothetical protein
MSESTPLQNTNGLTKRKTLGPPLPLSNVNPSDFPAEPATPKDKRKQEIADRWQGAFKKIKQIKQNPPPKTFAGKVGQYVYLRTENPGLLNLTFIF